MGRATRRAAVASWLCGGWLLLSGSLGGAARFATASEAERESLRVYFVGNSVTDTINYAGLEQLAASRDYQLVWGRHMIPGAPLEWIWNHPDQGFQQPPFGYYSQALAEHSWDILCLQPFDRQLDGPSGDAAMGGEFIRRALGQNPELQVYVYARWPRRDDDGSLDYDRKWSRAYTGQWDGTNETDDYFRRLVAALRRSIPELQKPVLLVPVGHVLHRLDQLARAGHLPGLSQIADVYEDQIHLTPLGSYMVACTFYATLYRESPVDLACQPYGDFDPHLARMVQRVAWEIVASHPLAGVRVGDAARPARSRAASPPHPIESGSSATGSPDATDNAQDNDARYRTLVVGTWEDDYQGKRTMNLRADGTGTMVVEPRGMAATLFAARLQFDMEWSLEDGRLKKRTIGGTPQARVNMILRMMGDHVDQPILELTEERLLLLDQDGTTRYDWRRTQ